VREPAWTPQLDLYEDAAAFVLEADVPGVREQDVSVTIEEGELMEACA
jgi:HSP20 family molecular chaperone IbpA